MCRYWRQSVISTPENWTRISSKRAQLAKLGLERSKAASLVFSIDMDEVRSNAAFSDLINPYIKNTDTLYLQSDSSEEEFEQTLQSFLPSMQSLRSLTLVNGNLGIDGWGWTNDPFSSLPPSLTHLSLINIPLYPSFLHIGTLTSFSLLGFEFNLHIDTLLDFLEANQSLESAILSVVFPQTSLRSSQRREAIKNQLRNLTIYSLHAADNNAFIAQIAVQKGANLEICIHDPNVGLNDVRSTVSQPHLLNLRSPTFMEYHPEKRNTRLLGPNGCFSLTIPPSASVPFEEFVLLPLDDIRTFHLIRCLHTQFGPIPTPEVFPPFPFPALETLIVEHEPALSQLFSILFHKPFASPSLKSLAFLDCDIDESFMDELIRFSSRRKKTKSAWLYRVVIVNSKGTLPRFASIDRLGKYVPVVDVRLGKELPSDLKQDDLLGPHGYFTSGLGNVPHTCCWCPTRLYPDNLNV